jgi:catechol 2,3-dioxygenase-like lactoylglutathione lyase family enzyme
MIRKICPDLRLSGQCFRHTGKKRIVMKRLHINLHVTDLEESVKFYSGLFGAEPVVLKKDYAKWAGDNPSMNFSISLSETQKGINHLGIETDSGDELHTLYNRLDQLKGRRTEEGDTVCCYAKSHKNWIRDPQEVEWEIFHTYGESDTYSNRETDTACCIPLTK